MIGLTIVAAGTSFPELASAVASARRGAHEFVLGNIIGSNLFNTLVVVGMATVISPLAPGANGEPAFSRHVLTRDIPLMTALPLSLLRGQLEAPRTARSDPAQGGGDMDCDLCRLHALDVPSGEVMARR